VDGGLWRTPVIGQARNRRFTVFIIVKGSSCWWWYAWPCPVDTRASRSGKSLLGKGWRLVRWLWFRASSLVSWFRRNAFFEGSRESFEHRSRFRIFEIEFLYVAVKMTGPLSFLCCIAWLLFGASSSNHFVNRLPGWCGGFWCGCCLAWNASVLASVERRYGPRLGPRPVEHAHSQIRNLLGLSWVGTLMHEFVSTRSNAGFGSLLFVLLHDNRSLLLGWSRIRMWWEIGARLLLVPKHAEHKHFCGLF